MSSRRTFLRGLAVGAAGAAGSAMVGRDLIASAATTAPECAPPPAPAAASSPRAGWNIYDDQAVMSEHLTALRAQRPTLLRWMCSWDRHHRREIGADGIPAVPDWLNGPYRPFFDELRASAANPRGTTLVVQVMCKGMFWTGDGWPYDMPGTAWALEHRYSGAMYPIRYGVAASYGAFVRSLEAALRSLGIEVVFGAWNEPDLRTSIGARYGAENFHDPWTVNPFDVVSGVPYFKWSGGSGTWWQQLHEQLTSTSYTTSGITYERWMQRTAQFTGVGVLDLHNYKGRDDVSTFAAGVADTVAAWDAAAPHLPRRKVLIGECATDVPAKHDLGQAAWLWQRHEALSQANGDAASPLYGRYMGMTSHSGVGEGLRAPWELAASDPAAAWWLYNPGYATYTGS